MMQTKRKEQDLYDWDKPLSGGNMTTRFQSTPESLDIGSSSQPIWDAILNIPGVRSWRILRDAAFLLSSFPIGLTAFLILVIGGVTGLSLSWALIGIPILIWTIGFTLRLAGHERQRLNTLLNTGLEEPNYPANNGENAFQHVLQIVRSPQVRNDLAYMALLFPIGIVELALVLAPLEFFVPSLLHMAFGSFVSFDVFGLEIGSRPEAMLFMLAGLVLLVPMLVLMNIATNAHIRLAQRFLQRKR